MLISSGNSGTLFLSVPKTSARSGIIRNHARGAAIRTWTAMAASQDGPQLVTSAVTAPTCNPQRMRNAVGALLRRARRSPFAELRAERVPLLRAHPIEGLTHGHVPPRCRMRV